MQKREEIRIEMNKYTELKLLTQFKKRLNMEQKKGNESRMKSVSQISISKINGSRDLV